MAKKGIEIWTIGHSTWKIEEFIGLLQPHDIRAIADVRQFPGSRRYPQFGQEQLSQSLAAAGIDYIHFPELGGRRRPRADSPNTAWRNEAFRGYADYMMGSEFDGGIERLLKVAAKKRMAMMCAEVLWWRCHRALVSDYLKANGHQVVHILGTGKTQEHPYTSAARIVSGKLSYRAPELGAQMLL
jgi:uncharacterized protein (DUF488 family)